MLKAMDTEKMSGLQVLKTLTKLVIHTLVCSTRAYFPVVRLTTDHIPASSSDLSKFLSTSQIKIRSRVVFVKSLLSFIA